LGAESSLLQLTYRRFRGILPAEHILIATHADYLPLVKEQLPELPAHNILPEPTRQDTAPVYARCAYHIRARDAEAVIAFSPCDHFIAGEEEFLSAVRRALDFVTQKPCLLTMGIHPTRPETEYGYIQFADTVSEAVCRVQTFTEKPQADIARVFVESGEFVWNSGLVFGQVGVMIEAIRHYIPELSAVLSQGLAEGLFGTEREQAFIDNWYPALPRLSFEYGVLEKIQEAYVLMAAGFDWADMGSWSSLYTLSEKDTAGNASINGGEMECIESSGNLIAVPNGRLAIVKDLNGYLVAASDKVLLVCKRDDVKSMRSLLGASLARSDGDRFQ
jgi:mannose-1-phosphate guanylyltransferase